MTDPKFIPGLLVKAPHERAPEYVKAKISLKREELMGWLSQQSGDWINLDVKVSQGGKWYAAIDDWKPESRGSAARTSKPSRERREHPDPHADIDEFDDSDIPF